MLDFLYEARDDDRRPFGDKWCGPDRLDYGKDYLCAVFEKYPGGDGQTCEVYISALPARFYKIKALASPNSVGEMHDEWALGTGSGAGRLAADIAKAIAEGMLQIDRRPLG